MRELEGERGLGVGQHLRRIDRQQLAAETAAGESERHIDDAVDHQDRQGVDPMAHAYPDRMDGLVRAGIAVANRQFRAHGFASSPVRRELYTTLPARVCRSPATPEN